MSAKTDRGRVRGRATRLEKKAEDELKKQPPDKQQLKYLQSEIDKVINELQNLDKQVYDEMMAEESSSEADVDTDQQEAESRREKLSLIKMEIDELLGENGVLEKLQSKRKETRAVLSDLVKKAKAEMQKADASSNQLNVFLKMLQSKLEQEREISEKVCDRMLEVDSSDEIKKIEREETTQFHIEIEEVIGLVAAIAVPRSGSPVPSTSSSATSVDDELGGFAKPPPMKFDGKLENWLAWWKFFQGTHESKKSDNYKLRQLYQCMTPGTRAERIVKTHFHMREGGYQHAVDTLKDIFGDEQLLQQVYVRKLAKLIMQKNEMTMSLTEIYDEIATQLTCLRSLDVQEATLAFLFPFIESAIPESTLVAWQRSEASGYMSDEKMGPEEQLKRLMLFLKAETKAENRRKEMAKGEESPAKDVGFKKPFDPKKKGSGENTKRKATPEPATAAGLTASKRTRGSSEGPPYPCVFCDRKNHPSHDCLIARKWPREQKEEKCEQKSACYRCLIPGHLGRDCKKKLECIVCGRSHHPIMCFQLDSRPNEKDDRNQKRRKDDRDKRDGEGSGSADRAHANKSSSNVQRNHAISTRYANFSTSDLVLLKTVLVKVKGPKGERIVRLLIDEGSQVSYVGRATIGVTGSKTVATETVQNVLLGGITTDFHEEEIKEVILESLDGRMSKTWLLREKPLVCTMLPRIPAGEWVEKLRSDSVELSDLDGSHVDEKNVEILIGSDFRCEIMTGRRIDLGDNLVAEESVFGWTLSGPVPCRRASVANMMISICLKNMKISDLFSLESLGICDPIEAQSKKEQEIEALQHFNDHVKRNENGRYSVPLPFVGEKPPLSSNKEVSLRRLQSTTNKLKSKQLFGTYDGLFNQWVDEDFVEEVKVDVTSLNHHFLPHHAVFKPNSLTTPVRPVFDASAKTREGVSLNDCLYKGPNLIELIPDVLLRFRERKIGVFSDIRKAFQTIEINEEDRNYQCFLWWKSDKCQELKVMRHNRVVFGIRSSPFLLGATLKYHLEQVQDERRPTAMKLLRSLYIDNSLPSVDSYEDYVVFKKEATMLLEEAKMPLRQWSCTADPSHPNAVEIELKDEKINVLGLLWNRVRDSLSLDIKLSDENETPKLTKRKLLSEVAKVFDPIGISAPVTLLMKLLIQQSWIKGISWDERMSDDEVKTFTKWYDELKCLRDLEIPRQVVYTQDVNNLQLHCFVDASKVAYSALVFLRSERPEGVKVALLQAKSRVAPVKKCTIPRLELMGCLIGSRLVKSIKEAMDMEGVVVYCWSDSTVAIYWIIRDDEVWARFVNNRVKEIRENTPKDSWNHVSGPCNPADLYSRGCASSELLASQCWEGPQWLHQPKEEWPCVSIQPNEVEIAIEKCKTVMAVSTVKYESWFKTKYSSFIKTVRVMSWILRYVQKLKQKNRVRGRVRNKIEFLTINEMRLAEKKVMREIQKEFVCTEEYLKKCGKMNIVERNEFVCVKVRYLNREDKEDFKYPIIVPGKHPLIQSLIRELHLAYGHAGVQFVARKLREAYWITGGRKPIKTVLHKCPCARFDARPVEVEEGQLPQFRVGVGEVFETTGVDLAGPLSLNDGTKSWVIIFTCALYRCVHFDVTTALSAEAFLNALERFINQYGRPKTFHTDNGTNFVASANLIRALNWDKIVKESNEKLIEWSFNPPAAPWYGGYWERLIRDMKKQLRKILGKASLSYDELRTCLSTVQTTMNQRPLTALTEDDGDLIPLTPAQFMHPTRGGYFIEGDHLDGRVLSRNYKKMRELQRQLKRRFRDEYIAMLIQKKKKGKKSLEVDDIVLVHSEKKRYEWPLARVIQVYPNPKDGIVRVVKVQLPHEYEIQKQKDGKVKVVKVKPGSIMKRPVQKLYPLEIAKTDVGELSEIIKTKAKSEHEKRKKIPVSDRGETQQPGSKLRRSLRQRKQPDRLTT